MLGNRGSRFDARRGGCLHVFLFFNLVEKNLSRVKKFFKCCENGIACLRKRKLQWRQVDVRSVDGLELSFGCSLRFGNSLGAYVLVVR